MKIPMACCGSTFQKGQILAVTRQQSWMQLHIRSTQDLGKHSAGKLPLKFSTESLQCSMTKALRRSVESALATLVRVMQQCNRFAAPPDGHEKGIRHKLNRHCGTH